MSEKNITEKREKSYRKTRKKNENRMIAIGSVIFIILIVIAAIFLKKSNTSENIIEGEDTTIADTVVEETQIEDWEMLEIDTPYGYLFYPKKYEEWLDIADTSAENELAITFYTSVTGDEMKMFTVYFGNESKGEFMGYVTEDENKIPVTIEVVQEELDANISADKKETYYGMIDGVNQILTSIMNFETYVEE